VERKEEQHAHARCCFLCFEVFMEEQYSMLDARNIHIGEAGMAQLVQWLRQTNRPQTLEALTERYLEILKELLEREAAS
jgi:hypothetical protein